MSLRARLTAPLLIALLAVIATACSAGSRPTPTPTLASYAGWPPDETDFELIPVPVTTEITVGPTRLLVNLLDDSNASVAAPDRPVTLNLFDLAANSAQPAVTAPATYMTTIPQLPGLYRATVNFTSAGAWGLETVTTEPDGSHRTGRMIFEVSATGTTPALGASVPNSDTPTATDAAGIAALSTDDDPDPDFYTTSVADAVTAHEAFVLVFATPAFCQSATVDGHLQPVLTSENLPITVPAVDEWGLPTEPYVFVVDGAGKLSAKFEGIAAEDELRAAFKAVAGS